MEFEEFVWKVEAARRHIEIVLNRKTEVRYFEQYALTHDEKRPVAEIEIFLNEDDLFELEELETIRKALRKYGFETHKIFFETVEGKKGAIISVSIEFDGKLD